MNSPKALALLAVLVSAPLAGCTTSATSTHATDPLSTASAASLQDPLMQADLAPPPSDYTSTKGDPSQMLLQMGKQHFAAQNYGLSEKYFRQAVEVRTDSASAWAGLAASYDQLGNFAFADRAYSQLVKLKGNDARVLNNLGYSYLLRGDYGKAKTYFNRARKADPALETIEGNLQLLDKVTNS